MMPVEDRNTITRHISSETSHHVCCGLKIKDVLQIISQLLLPLILAIFTIIITFDQRSENRIQRNEDRSLAEEQRLQDLNISREQRENDRWIAEEQRQHDKQIAIDKRTNDDLNADIQRNMTRDQRMYELDIEQERYKKDHEKYLDNLLLSYYNEMGVLFQNTNGTSLAFNPIIFSLARAKTLNVIEQVGPIRSRHLIMFLYGANQLTIQNKSLDLTEAYLNNIDLRSQRTLINIHLVGAYLNNASFDGQDLSYANFQNAHLNNASFKGSICIGTRFDGAYLNNADFTSANITHASFIQTNMQKANLYQTFGYRPLFQYTRMQQTNFSNSQFKFEQLDTKGFVDSNLAQSHFYNANLEQSRFIYCNLTQVDFTHANLRSADMTGSTMSYASFDHTDLGWATLYSANLSYANLSTIQCTGGQRNISACRLHQALTTDNALLPNNSFGVSLIPFFTEKDLPYCPQNVFGAVSPFGKDSQWKIEPPNSVFNQYTFLAQIYVRVNACVITSMQTTVKVNMTKNIDLTKYSKLIGERRARAVIQCFAGYNTQIGVTELNNNQSKLEPDEWVGFRWFRLLKPTTTILQITIQFSNPFNDTSSWLRDLQLYIHADIRAPDTYLLHSNDM
ncbi:unnamed protein product [Adineta steineri]|uniref:Pentapeptide repeat-containing protein n=1 Tax=Adineta steineri TaxID=433720 RepID=A0A819XER0_9BILA|nr:unnamed protein product [Adineta steineri]CAF4139191.1 unnamed protein product [Adineta steineri]